MRIGPPCAIIAEMPPMAISASDRSKRSQCTGVDNLARFLQCGMKAVVESDLYAAPVRSCSGNYWFQFVRSASRGLLHQHMLSRFHGRQSNRRQGIVRGGNNYYIYVRSLDGHPPIYCLRRVLRHLNELVSSLAIAISCGHESMPAAQSTQPLLTDLSATDNGDVHRL